MRSTYRAWHLVLGVAIALGCAGPIHIPPGSAPRWHPTAPIEPMLPPDRRAESVVVVALDGVRWQDVFHGVERERGRRAGLSESELLSARDLVPNLHRLATRDGAAIGAPGAGPPMRASGPRFVSLPGYAEIFTGRSSGCVDNDCAYRPERTIADEAAWGRTQRWASFVISSWPRIGRVATGHREDVVVSTGREEGEHLEAFTSEPAGREVFERGANASPEPSYGAFRPDRHTAELALYALRTHRPRFTFVGLGEPDEYAHRGDYRAYLTALAEADAFIGEVERVLSEWEGGATLFVTTDHGRSATFHSHGDDPESGRVWLVAAGEGITARGLVESPDERRLADIAPTVRALLGLPPDPGPDGGRPLAELWQPRAPRRDREASASLSRLRASR